MCRMLAVISQRPLDTSYLQEFRKLSETGWVSSGAKSPGHRDGWGIVRIDGRPYDLGHRAVDDDGQVEADAAVSGEFERVVERIGEEGLDGVFLAHLRKASSGRRVRANTAPSVDGGWAFSHNGTVFGLGSEEVSDSRRFFRILVEEIRDRGDAVEGIRTAVEKLQAGYSYSSLTFLLSDGRSLYAYRDYTADGDYYALRYARADDSTLIFAQEETWRLRWTSIPNRSLVVAERDLRIKGPFRI